MDEKEDDEKEVDEQRDEEGIMPLCLVQRRERTSEEPAAAFQSLPLPVFSS